MPFSVHSNKFKNFTKGFHVIFSFDFVSPNFLCECVSLSVLLEGLKYYANEPQRLGRTFLRLVRFNWIKIPFLINVKSKTCLIRYFQERDFDKHAQYYGDEPKSQELLREDKHLREFFEVSRLCFSVVVVMGAPPPHYHLGLSIFDLSSQSNPISVFLVYFLAFW